MNIREELEQLTVNGVLKAEDVVTFAQNPDTALHSQFEWNDGDAAHQYRLEQARKLIRVHVIQSPATQELVRKYVSLSSDRKAGGGYRTLVSVLSDDELYQQMLTDALQELRVFREKYKRIRELEAVMKAVDAVEVSRLAA